MRIWPFCMAIICAWLNWAAAGLNWPAPGLFMKAEGSMMPEAAAWACAEFGSLMFGKLLLPLLWFWTAASFMPQELMAGG